MHCAVFCGPDGNHDGSLYEWCSNHLPGYRPGYGREHRHDRHSQHRCIVCKYPGKESSPGAPGFQCFRRTLGADYILSLRKYGMPHCRCRPALRFSKPCPPVFRTGHVPHYVQRDQHNDTHLVHTSD